MNRIKEFLAISILVLFGISYGLVTHGAPEGIDTTSEAPFFEIDWHEERQTTIIKEENNNPDTFNITKVNLPQKIYRPDKDVNITFNVRNPYNHTYDVQVSWFRNKSRVDTWNNEEFSKNNSNIITRRWYSWRTVKEKGSWTVQILVTPNSPEERAPKERILKFEVR